MFAKGKIRGNGVQLARYLMTGEEGERVELLETRGLEAFGPDPVAAFAALQDIADANTRSTKPFFHGHIRLPADERLTDAQWMETLELMEKRLGFEGQPRIVTFHHLDQNGDKHLHVGWFRIDLETMRAIDPGLYKNELRELCRDRERAYGLRQLDNERQAHDIAPAASQKETEESRRLGTDVREIRAAILDCLERSDSGRAFKVAVEERGLMLANGDRRDCFVVIDQAGGQHALNKKLTGMKLATIRERFADLDRSQLPSVEQAQEMQRHRQAERTAQPEAANQNIREPMTLEAITLDPWKAVDLALPKDADRTLLAAVALCADQCAKVAFAYGRAAVIIEPEAAAFYRERHDSAAARRDEARTGLARLPPEQVAQVSPFLHPELLAQKVEVRLQAERAAQILARDPMIDSRPITAEAIRENPWNVLEHRLPQDAGRDLAEQVWNTAGRLYYEAIQHRDASYTTEERRLWDHYAALIENLPFRAAGERLAELDQQELKAEWRDAEREVGHRDRASAQFDAVEIKGSVKAAEREIEAAPMETAAAVREGVGLLAKIGQVVLGLFGGWAMAPPKLTPAQAKQEARAEAEAAPVRAAAAQEAAEWQTQEDGFEARRRAARQLEEAQLARILGHTSPAEAQRGVDGERTRQRERERDDY